MERGPLQLEANLIVIAIVVVRRLTGWKIDDDNDSYDDDG
jgi:hypothetical protein